MTEDLKRKRAFIRFCKELFVINNISVADLDDLKVVEVNGRNFPQQPDGEGLHISFSVSWDAVGKTGASINLGDLIPEDDT